MKILIVEDDPLTRKMMENMINLLKYDFESVSNGVEAINAVKERDFDIILMDINMPLMDGIKATEEIRKLEKECFIIMLTSYGDEEMMKDAALKGADDYIIKPVELNILKTKIELARKTYIFYKYKHEFLKETTKKMKLKEEEIEKLINENSKLTFELLEKLSKISEYRDDETFEHTQRVGTLSFEISLKLNLPYDFCYYIKYASPLHDIGKIGIPDRILLKPAKLTDSEFEIMKQHTIIGAEILKGSTSAILKMAETIALTHHERWDGNGYPNKLKGLEIPLEGRIVNLIDSIDAMATKRPYKEKYSEERVLYEIKNNKEKRYDPLLVDIVINFWDEIRENYY